VVVVVDAGVEDVTAVAAVVSTTEDDTTNCEDCPELAAGIII
jgi:hypothetical protein